MPTKHARIAITRDPEVEHALTAAARVLGPSKPEATLARELVLRGAKAVIKDARGDIDAELDRYLDERGDVIRATMSRKEAMALSRELLSQPIPPGPPMSEILDELREDRV
jgi:hypothetical protein